MKTKKQKLHIVFLDFDDIKNSLLGAGQARATVEVGKRLAKKGYKITVICSRFPGSYDRKENGIQYRHIGVGTSNIKLNNALYILALPLTVFKLKADIIFECFTAPISTLFTPLWTSIPVIAIPSTFDAKRFSTLYHMPFHLIEKIGSKFYKYFLPYTDELKIKMEKMNSKIVSKVVPEGVDKSFFKYKRRKPEYILFLGRFDMYQKGIDLLLYAYAKVENEIKYPLYIAGIGPDEEKIKKQIQRLGISSKVKVLGPSYGKEKKLLLEKARFVAFPSRNEGFSLFSLESLAAGLPLVSFDIPALSFTNKDVALKAKQFNIDHYAKLLKKASKARNMKQMSKNARHLASMYTWDSVVKEYESFIFEVLEKESYQKYMNRNLLQIFKPVAKVS